ncbi:MAG: (d)CMP kinase [Patescibacteria group bacterium]|nr:(d)CMP kinase [Patescibacteria group bacterium]
MSKGFVIAIDGPVAAGKGTISPLLAKNLNGFYLYTGAMYRCLALLCIKRGIDTKDENTVVNILPEFGINVFDNKVFLNGEDVTERIKREDVAMASSDVAVIKKVREEMVSIQQEIANKLMDEGKIVIAEGRDTATRVFPDAKLKIFLTATPEVRAKRRLLQIEERGEKAKFENVLKDVKLRDEQDLDRKIDPLVKNPEEFGYIVLDNSNMSEEETVDFILQKAEVLNDKN